MRRTREEAEKTRKHIINAAVKVMNKKGISSTRLKAKMRFYFHFMKKIKNKFLNYLPGTYLKK